MELLRDLVRHQAWADAEHWKILHSNPAVSDDVEIRKRLNHMVQACEMLQALARGETPDITGMKNRESLQELETAMRQATEGLSATVASADLDKIITLPRGPHGPFQAPAGLLLLQALLHGQHHRGQNAARMRDLGAKPPMTDYILWFALGRP